MVATGLAMNSRLGRQLGLLLASAMLAMMGSATIAQSPSLTASSPESRDVPQEPGDRGLETVSAEDDAVGDMPNPTALETTGPGALVAPVKRMRPATPVAEPPATLPLPVRKPPIEKAQSAGTPVSDLKIGAEIPEGRLNSGEASPSQSPGKNARDSTRASTKSAKPHAKSNASKKVSTKSAKQNRPRKQKS